jgi:hypothetical protein
MEALNGRGEVDGDDAVCEAVESLAVMSEAPRKGEREGRAIRWRAVGGVGVGRGVLLLGVGLMQGCDEQDDGAVRSVGANLPKCVDDVLLGVVEEADRDEDDVGLAAMSSEGS